MLISVFFPTDSEYKQTGCKENFHKITEIRIYRYLQTKTGLAIKILPQNTKIEN